ncbi:MAG: MarR family transcriptional regulator [Beijerinckiaceae bacterium]
MSSQDDISLRERVRGMGDVCYALQARKTANLMARVYNQAVADLGLEISQLTTLWMIAAESAETIAAMAEILGVERSTLVRSLALLQRDKLIARDKSGGRRAVYRLTPRGRALVEQSLPRWERIQSAIARVLGPPEAPDPRVGMRNLRRAALTAAASAS